MRAPDPARGLLADPNQTIPLKLKNDPESECAVQRIGARVPVRICDRAVDPLREITDSLHTARPQ